MYINLKPYLEELRAAEGLRPEGERREVPTLLELARACGVHVNTVSNYANNNAILFNLEVGAKMIQYFRALGHNTDVGDILKYKELKPESSHQ